MRLIEHFFRLLAPDECQSCGMEGSLLCPACAVVLLERPPRRCYRCHRLSPASRTCQTCRVDSDLQHLWVRTAYNSVAKQLVYALKFNFTRSAAKLIAEEMYRSLPTLPADTVIVHVPTATARVRQRGFDQSALIARELSYRSGLMHVHALARLGQKRQVGASKQARQLQMADAFRPLSESAITNMHVLLVDDVLTTGATLEAAARTLRRAGARSVSAVVFASAA